MEGDCLLHGKQDKITLKEFMPTLCRRELVQKDSNFLSGIAQAKSCPSNVGKINFNASCTKFSVLINSA